MHANKITVYVYSPLSFRFNQCANDRLSLFLWLSKPSTVRPCILQSSYYLSIHWLTFRLTPDLAIENAARDAGVQTAFQQTGFVCFGYVPKWDLPQCILKTLQLSAITLIYTLINAWGFLFHGLTLCLSAFLIQVILTGLEWLSSVAYGHPS